MKKLSFEELMDIEVTSASKRSEKLSETASAIQVITGAEVRRSAASNLPDALRLLPNVRVAQLNSYAWIVTTRGFSTLFANKLLVLIDGRTVYTPLVAGVFWDVQNLLLEDLDKIEVISGPGGSLWGANAVNGVINITTKSARDTQGLYVSTGHGSPVGAFGAVRYGGRVGSQLYYRVYGQSFERGHSYLSNGQPDTDDWRMGSGGARLDWYPSANDILTLQGDVYAGTEHTQPDTEANGQNVLGRWTRVLGPGSDLQVQMYYDHTYRDAGPSLLTDRLATYDFDFQHRFPLGKAQSVLWGAGYRHMASSVDYRTTRVGFVPPERDMELFSGFLQDEIALRPDRLKLTLGAKLEHNVFSGFEIQPTVRLAWLPDARQTVWTAISRAIRSPSRIDVDFHIPGMDIQPGTRGVDGGPNFDSEKVVAYEAGYRVQPIERLSLSLAGFYNRYDDLYSVEALPGTPTFQIQNGGRGSSWGAELSGRWEATETWHFRGGYTYFRRELSPKAGHSYDPSVLVNDPEHQWVLQSILDLSASWQLDVTARYTGTAPSPRVPHFFLFDVRLAWHRANWEFSVVAQNLGDRRHGEFGAHPVQLPSGYFGRVTFRW
jgi:iron complex outermembrane receptor protein